MKVLYGISLHLILLRIIRFTMTRIKKYFLILPIIFVFTLLLERETYGGYEIDKIGNEIIQTDSTAVLEIIVNEGFRDGEYMKIAMQDGEDSEKIIFEGKIKRNNNNPHERVVFQTPIAKNEYNILNITTSSEKKISAHIGIKVTKGNYCELEIWKWPTENDILLMISDAPGIYD